MKVPRTHVRGQAPEPESWGALHNMVGGRLHPPKGGVL